MEELISIRERLYDLTVRLSCTDPEASHKAKELYDDMCDILRKIEGEG